MQSNPPANHEVQVIVLTNDPAVPNRIAWFLCILLADEKIQDYGCTREQPEDTPKGSLFWEQVKAMRFGHKFSLWGNDPAKLVDLLFSELDSEFGARIRVISPWTPRNRLLRLKIS